MTSISDRIVPENRETETLPAGSPPVSRRMLLATGSAVAAAGMAGGALRRHGAASDDGEDHSGPGGGGDDRHGDDGDDDHHGLPPAQSTQVANVTTVRIVDERFEPNNILISTGVTVSWENLDDDQHTASGKGMDTGVINPGEMGQVRFLEPGVFNYTCNFHPEMLGLVTAVGESMATPQASPVASPVAIPNEADVKIVDFAFEPASATVAVGGTVTWTNTGQTPHTIYAEWAQSEVLSTGDSFAHSFAVRGSHSYQCGLHPAMTGTIEVVEAGPATAAASPDDD